MTLLRPALSFICLTMMIVSARAQTSEWSRAEIYPGYPGSFLVTPQRSDFTAPGIYRSVNDRDNLGNPVEIKMLCSRDIEAMIKKKVFQPRNADVPDVQNYSTVVAGGGVGLDAKVIKVNAAAQYDNVVSLSTGSAKVLDSDDDDIAGTILANIQAKCRKTIESHLNRRRMVFVAEAAIQAFDYDAVVERVAAGSANVQCGLLSWCRWFGNPTGEVTAKLSSHSQELAPKTYVTIAMVPAEIGDRHSLNYADIGRRVPLIFETDRSIRVAQQQQFDFTPPSEAKYSIARQKVGGWERPSDRQYAKRQRLLKIKAAKSSAHRM